MNRWPDELLLIGEGQRARRVWGKLYDVVSGTFVDEGAVVDRPDYVSEVVTEAKARVRGTANVGEHLWDGQGRRWTVQGVNPDDERYSGFAILDLRDPLHP